MKASHRKTHWVHLVFSLILLAVLAGLLLLKRDLPAVVFASVFALYVIGNCYIHYRRGDFKIDTVVEYSLLAFAAFIVLISAL